MQEISGVGWVDRKIVWSVYRPGATVPLYSDEDSTGPGGDAWLAPDPDTGKRPAGPLTVTVDL